MQKNKTKNANTKTKAMDTQSSGVFRTLGVNAQGNIADPASASSWVYAAVNKIGNDIQSTQLKLWVGKQKNKKDISESELGEAWLNLINNPNPYQQGQTFFYHTLYLKIYGECLWYLKRDSLTDLPQSLIILSPSYYQAVIENGVLQGYQIRLFNHDCIIADPNKGQCIRFSIPSVGGSIYDSQSPLKSLNNAILTEIYSTGFLSQFFKNGSIVPMALISQENLSSDEKTQIKNSFSNQYVGMDNFYKTMLLDGGMTVQQLSSPLTQMEIPNIRDDVRKSILSVMGVNEIVMGIYSDVKSYEGVKSALSQYWIQTIKPELKRIQEGLWYQLFQYLPSQIYPEFDLSENEYLNESLESKILKAQALIGLGYPLNTVNEVIGLGMPAVEWGNKNPNEMPSMYFNDTSENTETQNNNIHINETSINTGFKPISIEQKNIETKAINDFNTIQKASESTIQSAIDKWIYSVRKDILKKLPDTVKHFEDEKNKSIDFNVLFDSKTYMQKLYELLFSPYKRAYSLGLQSASKLISVPVKSDYSPDSKYVLKVATNRLNKILPDIVENTKKSIIEAVKTATEAGSSISGIESSIKDYFNSNRSRSLTIARTESSTLVNTSRFDVFQNENIKKHKWVSSIDGATRPEHVKMNGEIVEVGKKFSNGLKFPNDPRGKAKQVINCRCTTVPVTELDSMDDED